MQDTARELETGMLDTSRFQDADKYAAYLKTPAGRLRSELAWENARRFLPGNASECRALDVGGGTGGTEFVRSSWLGSRRRMWCSRVL
jgi:hypothetical protein